MALLLVQLFCYLCLTVAAVTSLFSIRHRLAAIPVTTKIIDIKVDEDSDGDTIYSPVFCVTGGAFDGKTWVSAQYTNIPDQEKVGDVATGTYNPKTGVIHTKNTLSGERLFAIVFLIAGLYFLYALRYYDI